MLIRNYGLFWKVGDAFWGEGGKGNKGGLFGVPAKNVTAEPVNFRDQRGVYVLYAGYEMVYVGQVGSVDSRLFSRLKHHRSGSLSERWDRFSWFGINRVLSSNNKLADDAI